MTEDAKRLGFGLDATYAALDSELFVDGRQYGFPCNVNVVGFWANVETFRKVGMNPPPRTWDFATFEKIGKEFIRRANPPGKRQTVFFCNSASGWQAERWLTVMHRSLGLSIFNETLTRCTLDDERYARVLATIYKWTYEDHILPSAADEASFSSESGYGGSMLSLFQHGTYGMITIGRWCLIRIREFKHKPRLSVSAFPFEDFPNAVIGTRAAAVYAGSPNRDKAVLFLAFLASADYNQNIVREADALPPSPKYTNSEEYLRPPQYPNEWGCHEVPVEFSQTIAIGFSRSPFLSSGTVSRLLRQGLDKVMANLATPRQAARETAKRINAEIQRTIRENSCLARRYRKYIALQEKIDQIRGTGKKVPMQWIK
ncbi:MAG TPA: carbohydrate ABC transporter substrate-binding protein, partial [Planctomycetaceae bacterium]|nr:carbohydrate ABC transporter substrate-binding protein [Planctomycetaceae bacterium]